ncbi:MAG: metal-dependent transcriptional regulator [Anaerolineales bacterium]|nr:metal-dependent transcriptional regulator [Chloroflexota bacterium]MBL6983555.1 metal-dependent transcriptional regulator [Anaerolineales bacterium]
MPDPLISLIIAALLTIVSVWVFRPESGVFWRWQRARKTTARVLREDALKHIHQNEIHNRRATVKSIAGALNVSVDAVADLLEQLEDSDLLQVEGDSFRLTPVGRDYALQIIRAHRLWERYLADATGYEEEEWHGQAEQYEHMLSPDEARRLSAQLGNPTHDPHGDPIPTAEGEMVYRERVALPDLTVDKPARITHLEDEPEAVYAQLVAEGLHVGMVVRMVEASSRRIRFWAGGDEHTLAPLIAVNVGVEPLPDEVREQEHLGETLTSLTPGESGQVLSISPRIRGAERRRLMDLGILPGTVIESELSSPSGDPVGYRVRGAVIALRSAQANQINITRINN